MSGCVNHRDLIVENEWNSLKVGCLVFNGSTYEKRIITINDCKFLSDLKNKFKTTDWILAYTGVPPRENRLLLYLRGNQTIEMCFMDGIPDFNLAIEAQDGWEFRAKVSPDFINDLLQYLEQTTHSQVRFYLTDQEYRQAPPPWKSGYCFFDIDFGHGEFCLLSGDINLFNKISEIRGIFVFEPIMNNSYAYLNEVLANYKPYLKKLDYSNCFLVYYEKDYSSSNFSSGLYMDKGKEDNRFQESSFALLIKEVIRNKASLIIYGGEKKNFFEATSPLTICHFKNELFNTLQKQFMKVGGPYVIFIPEDIPQKGLNIVEK